jgi:Holliday junction resolvase RusA-like endonuclease
MYKIHIPGTPPRKNRRHILVGSGKFSRPINSPEFKAFALDLEVVWAKAGHPKIHKGLWHLTLHAVWPRTRHLDVPVALGDVDAPISWVLDALQVAGILDDDARVVELGATKSQGAETGITVSLSPLGLDG